MRNTGDSDSNCSLHETLPSSPLSTPPAVMTQTKIVILMDDAEERRPSKQRVSSIPLLRQLNLQQCSIHPVRSSRAVPLADLRQWADLSSPHTALLYPSDSSTVLGFSQQQQQSSPPCSSPESTATTTTDTTEADATDTHTGTVAIHTLLVLDGSWRTVQQLLYHNRSLQPPGLRHVRLDLAASYTSYYQRHGLRQEPAPNCVSTAEAIALALLRLEEPSNQAGHVILTAFRRFVQQLNASAVRGRTTSCGDDDDSDGEICFETAGDGAASSGNKKRKLTAAPNVNDGTFDYYNDHDSEKEATNSTTLPASSSFFCGDGSDMITPPSPSLLLRSKGVKETHSLTKAQKRKGNRKKEKRRKK
jgi:DTW domain-containing protein YfiP